MSLVPLVTKIAIESGCHDRARCEQVLQEAASKQGSLVEALLDADLVDEVEFAEHLAQATGLNYQAESELDLSQPLHSRFPAKLALRHHLLPGDLNGKDVCLMTYDPFDLKAKQVYGN